MIHKRAHRAVGRTEMVCGAFVTTEHAATRWASVDCPDCLMYYSGVPHEGTCQRCKAHYVVWFTDNDLWNKYHGNYAYLCPRCFSIVAERSGENTTGWYLTTEERTPHLYIVEGEGEDSPQEGREPDFTEALTTLLNHYGKDAEHNVRDSELAGWVDGALSNYGEGGESDTAPAEDSPQEVCATCGGTGKVESGHLYVEGPDPLLPCPDCITAEQYQSIGDVLQEHRIGNTVKHLCPLCLKNIPCSEYNGHLYEAHSGVISDTSDTSLTAEQDSPQEDT